jgi:hypothetical protein
MHNRCATTSWPCRHHTDFDAASAPFALLSLPDHALAAPSIPALVALLAPGARAKLQRPFDGQLCGPDQTDQGNRPTLKAHQNLTADARARRPQRLGVV